MEDLDLRCARVGEINAADGQAAVEAIRLDAFFRESIDFALIVNDGVDACRCHSGNTNIFIVSRHTYGTDGFCCCCCNGKSESFSLGHEPPTPPPQKNKFQTL